MKKPSALSKSARTKTGNGKPGEIPWPLLFRLWRDFIGQDSMPLLDRWLKHWFKQGKPLELAQQLLLSRTMLDAVAFVQLACALEQAYQQKNLDIDWNEWDKHWHFDQVKIIPVASVWSWFVLRCGMNAAGLNVKDLNERQQFFNAASREVETSHPLDSAFASMWFGIRPQWGSLIRERAATSQWSEEAARQFIHRQTQIPPLWLRPQQAASLEELATTLKQEGVDIGVTPDGHLYAKGGKGINNTQAYQQGLVEIQDLASQQIAQAVAAQPGQKVWDSCAGAGGKTLAIASRMANKGVLVATDIHSYKLDELKRRAKRAGLFNIRCFPWGGASPLQLPKEVARQAGFDWVLVDAPCSSAGTWRRNPDARWRFNQADTGELIHLQRQILAKAALAVRPGGYLVYATCSWQVDENEAQVSWFLQAHPDFRLVSQQLLGAPVIDADTMFVAVLSS